MSIILLKTLQYIVGSGRVDSREKTQCSEMKALKDRLTGWEEDVPRS